MVNVGKPKRFVRGFSKHVWESALCADFHTCVIFHSPLRQLFCHWRQRSGIFEMPRTYRRFETTFKRHVVEQIESGRLSPTQAARDYQIARSLIERWREQYRNNGFAESPSRRERQLEEENEKLKAKIGDLIMEMDHIKKWQAWVQRQKSADRSRLPSPALFLWLKSAMDNAPSAFPTVAKTDTIRSLDARSKTVPHPWQGR